jgi:uncharacterized protein
MTVEQKKIIQDIAEEVKNKLSGEGSGHDWWHIVRVWNMAKRIGLEEGGELFVIELGALLHDIADWKFHDGDDTVGPQVAREIMKRHGVARPVLDQVADIVSTISFKGAGVPTPMKTLEGKVVQDADRLDAIGAIGIARAFAYGGHKERLIYDPEEKPTMHQSKEAYFRDTGSTVKHFYEKLLLLKNRMNTEAGKKRAEGRHAFMEEYLERFYQEWEGKL